jgi:hypothetical protein
LPCRALCCDARSLAKKASQHTADEVPHFHAAVNFLAVSTACKISGKLDTVLSTETVQNFFAELLPFYIYRCCSQIVKIYKKKGIAAGAR